MIRVLALIARRPDITRDAFRDHYETVHAPLALPQLGDIPHYARNHLAPGLDHLAAPFDVLSEFGYADPAAVGAVTKRLASPAGDPIRQDELRFMDRERNVFFPLDPVRARRGTGVPGALTVVLLARAPEGGDRGALAARHLEELERLLEPADSILAFRSVDGARQAPYDAVTFVRHPAEGGFEKRLAAWDPRPGPVLRLRVIEHATRRSAAWAGG